MAPAEQITLYAGFDEREEVGYHTFVSSVLHTSSLPVKVTPIGNALVEGLNGRRHEETTDFARARFLIPYLEQWRGWALFCDGSDMIVRRDIAELWSKRDLYKAVQVVKHQYRTRHRVKYVGTPLESTNRDYPCKNWSSVMLINCAHFAWRNMVPETVKKMDGAELQQFSFMGPGGAIGEIPIEWNWLVDEYGPSMDARLLHWTAGLPFFEHYRSAPMADEWFAAAGKVVGMAALEALG